MTSIETGPSWFERLNPRNWTLIWKLVIVGLAPALLALTLGALRISDQAGSAAQLGASVRLLDVREDVAATGDALRAEDYQASLFVASARTGDRAALRAAQARTDSSIAVVQKTTSASSSNSSSALDLDQSGSAAAAQAANELTRLAGLRSQVTDNPAFALAQIRSSYSEIIEGIDALDRVLLREVRVPDTGGRVDALTAAQAVESQLAVQHGLVGDAIRSRSLQPDDRNAVDAADIEIASQYRTYQLSLSPQQLQSYGTFLDDPANSRRDQLATALLNAPVSQPFPVTAGDWDAAFTGSAAAVDHSADLIRRDVRAAGVAAEQQASNLAGINSVILLLGLFLGIAIAVLVARSLIRSLRVLRGAALDVAERRLPGVVASMRAGETPDVTVDPVPIGTRDEVGQVARAFDAVHGQAVRLAADQAALQSNVSAMFVNLSRRSQALVERQLQLIEQLESNEQDADQLSNLFQLDHLATRMRRNSENLLVLAGTDLAKRNIAPVPMVDVLRAAVSEVEQYQRVVVQAPPSAAILGRAGSDLVHLLAELLDNATNFSPPDSQVVMSTARTPDGAIVVEIADRGVGMADHELSDANQRLSGPATVDVSASRRMGLFVVGRLAARHGIDVQLAGAVGHGPGAGLTASVTVPTYLVPRSMPIETGRPVGMTLLAGVPSQSGPSANEIPAPRPDTTGGRSGALAALATGDAGPAVDDRPQAPEGDGLFSGRPAANGSVNGLPTRLPGSSLRPDGPGGGPGGPPRRGEDAFAGDGSDGPAETSDRARRVAEQARQDQEAAARRDRRDRDGAAPPPVNGHTPAPVPAPTPTPTPEAGDQPAGPGAAPATTPMPVVGSARHDRPGTPVDIDPPARPSGSSLGGPAPADAPASAELDGEQSATGRLPIIGSPLPKRPTPRSPRAAAPAVSDAPAFDAPASDAPALSTPEPNPPTLNTPAPGTPAPNTPAPDAARPSVTPLPRRRPAATRPEQPRTVEEPVAAGHEPFAGAADVAPYVDAAPPYVDADPPYVDIAPPYVDAAPLDSGAALSPPIRSDLAGPGPRPEPESFEPLSAPAGADEFADPWPAPRAVTAPTAPPRPAPFAELLHTPARSDAPGASDALFGPSMPILGAGDGHGDDPHGFDIGETTPIFEEIASAWFRSNRPVPVSWQTEPDAPTPPGEPESSATPAPAVAPATQPAPAPEPVAAPRAANDPPRPRPSAAMPPTPSVRPAASSPAPAPEPVPAPPRPNAQRLSTPELARPDPAPRPAAPAVSIADAAAFSTSADEGWRAARGADAAAADELTAAGLPKRRPRARLVPGSAGAAVLAQPVSAARSAENIRGRLSSYQQGVRQGRETRLHGGADGNADAHLHDPAREPVPDSTFGDEES